MFLTIFLLFKKFANYYKFECFIPTYICNAYTRKNTNNKEKGKSNNNEYKNKDELWPLHLSIHMLINRFPTH